VAKEIVKVVAQIIQDEGYRVCDKEETRVTRQWIPASAFKHLKKEKLDEGFFSAQWDSVLGVWNIGSPSKRAW